MNILNSVIKLFVGDKQQKDLKDLQPIVADVKKFIIYVFSVTYVTVLFQLRFNFYFAKRNVLEYMKKKKPL